jgi:hypothetical protein
MYFFFWNINMAVIGGIYLKIQIIILIFVFFYGKGYIYIYIKLFLLNWILNNLYLAGGNLK